MTKDTEVQTYLARLRASLIGMTLAEREDIVEEIRMHIRERSSDPHTTMEEIIARLGPADELAQQYRTGLLVQKARHSISPLLILRATLRWATTGVEGFVVFMIATIGYLMGVGFLVLAFLKPLLPKYTGLWVGPGEFAFSVRMGGTMTNPAPPVHEVLGWWFIPICLVLGSLSLTATTKLIQFLLRRFRWQVPFVASAQVRPVIMAM
jgi:uncharacterized membrane protein